MRYRIDMKGFPTLYLTEEQLDELAAALASHIANGDGETRFDHVTITEVGVKG